MQDLYIEEKEQRSVLFSKLMRLCLLCTQNYKQRLTKQDGIPVYKPQ